MDRILFLLLKTVSNLGVPLDVEYYTGDIRSGSADTWDGRGSVRLLMWSSCGIMETCWNSSKNVSR